MTTLTVPLHISFHDWVCDLNRTLPNRTIPIPPKTDENWWNWAEEFLNANNLAGIVVPSKILYPTRDSWRKWVFFLIQGASL